MTEFNSLDKLVVDTLIRHESVDIFDLHKEGNFGPIDIYKSIERLSASGIVQFSDGKVKRSKTFYEAVIRSRNQIFKRDFSWKTAKGRFRT